MNRAKVSRRSPNCLVVERMLKEWFLWLRSRCSPAARKLGHLAEAIALDARARRQAAHWQEHLQRTRQAILRVAAQCPSTRCAVILGSGSCRDVPVAELAAQFDRVLLVDIVHLPMVRARLRAFGNVELVEADLTGVADALAARKGRLSAEDLRQLPTTDNAVLQRADIDFVASVNLLSQLPIMPVDYLQRHSELALPQLNAFAWRLVRAHVAALQQLLIPVCLVADARQEARTADGGLLDAIDWLPTLNLPKPFDHWQWPVTPTGELADQRVLHEVVAIQLGGNGYRARVKNAGISAHALSKAADSTGQ